MLGDQVWVCCSRAYVSMPRRFASASATASSAVPASCTPAALAIDTLSPTRPSMCSYPRRAELDHLQNGLVEVLELFPHPNSLVVRQGHEGDLSGARHEARAIVEERDLDPVVATDPCLERVVRQPCPHRSPPVVAASTM